MIVTDGPVRACIGTGFRPWPVIEIGTGEESKTLATVERLYEAFLAHEIDRSSLIVAIGGGIVCDVAGFAASTYLRGLSFGFVPTTLLAQVDASVGGKNGVNFNGYKNLVGTFTQPRFVLCDPALLRTLPEAEVKNGFAEAVKQAAIGDETLFSYLEEHVREALSLDPDVVGHVDPRIAHRQKEDRSRGREGTGRAEEAQLRPYGRTRIGDGGPSQTR